MKKPIRILISLAIATASLCAFAADSGDSSAAQAALQPASPLPWLVAQRSPSCEMENRRVPVGARTCREGQEWVCKRTGQWEPTRKKC
jgi:hypothetical protein